MQKISDLKEFISLLDQNFSNEQLSAYFNCGISTIKRFKTKHNLIGYKTNSKPLSTKEITAITSLTDRGKSLQEICKLLGKSDYIIKKYVPNELYLRILTNSKNTFISNLIKADISNIFNPTDHSAYICGVLQSDGFLTSDGYIGVTAKDYDLVKGFANFFKTGVRSMNKENTTYYGCRFKDVQNLEKFKKITNIYPQKTYLSYNIPEWIKNNTSFIFNFIAGVFDGDGWVYPIKDRPNTIEIGIEQHINSKPFLLLINNYLGWNTYETDSTFRIHTKKQDKVKDFYNWYSNIEFIMLRKVSVFDSVYL